MGTINKNFNLNIKSLYAYVWANITQPFKRRHTFQHVQIKERDAPSIKQQM